MWVSIIVLLVGSLVCSSSVPKSNHGIIYICCIGFNFDVIASGNQNPLGFVKLTGAAAEAAAKEGKPLGKFRVFLVALYAFQTTHFIIYIHTHKGVARNKYLGGWVVTEIY